MNKKLTDSQVVEVARQHGIEPAALRAVLLVESAGDGFLPDGRCKILFEGHVFWRQLVIMGINPARLVMGNQDVLYELWDKRRYVGGAGEYERLEKAMRIHRTAALKSASYGLFQIMGFNHRACGYDTVMAFVDEMNLSEYHQLQAAVKFLQSQNLIRFLNSHSWGEFARRYNGPRYADNSYDLKLQKAYNQSLNLNTP